MQLPHIEEKKNDPGSFVVAMTSEDKILLQSSLQEFDFESKSEAE